MSSSTSALVPRSDEAHTTVASVLRTTSHGEEMVLYPNVRTQPRCTVVVSLACT